MQPKCSNGMRNQGARQQLCLTKETTFNQTFRQTTEPEIRKQTVGSPIRLRRTRVRKLWKSQPLPKQKKRLPIA
jgi:hypothetical protein